MVKVFILIYKEFLLFYNNLLLKLMVLKIINVKGYLFYMDVIVE